MYYFILTILIIIIYTLNHKFHFYENIKGIISNIKNLKKNTERFAVSNNDSNNTKLSKNVPNNIIVLNKFEDTNKEITLSLDLVYLDPKYQFEKTTYLYGKKNTFENREWKQNFQDQICHSEKGGCSCIKVEDGEEICGIKSDNNIYECAQPCPDCHSCHLRPNNIQLQYLEFCNKAQTEEEKDKCQKYQERVLLSKEKCIFSDNNDKRLIKKKDRCKMFLPSRYNSFLVGQDIIFKINISYANSEIKKMVEQIEITDFRVDNKEININQFYNSKKEIFLFILASQKIQGLNKIVKVNGNIFFKDNVKPKIEFSNKNVVNIFPVPEQKEPNATTEEIIQKQIDKKINPIPQKQIVSVDDDKFNHHYLGESRYYGCQKVNNYTTLNSIKDLPNGTFQKFKMIDNLDSWKSRADINRPWDYIIN